MERFTRTGAPSDRGVNVTTLVTPSERYVFLFTDKYLPDAIKKVGEFASREDLAFSWHDAARVSLTMRKQVRRANE